MPLFYNWRSSRFDTYSDRFKRLNGDWAHTRWGLRGRVSHTNRYAWVRREFTQRFNPNYAR